jgi:16S rRNA G1207 methylase RsmC
MRHPVDIAGLRVRKCDIDVGCGVGLIAARLAHFVNARGSCDAFDIVKEAVDWCSEDIGAENPVLGLSGFLCARHIMTTNRSQYAKQAQAALRGEACP